MKYNFNRSFLIVLIILILAQQRIYAQGSERPMQTTSNGSQIYFEMGGAGIIYSFNYDGRFSKYENGLGFRIGIGGASVEGSGYYAVPVQINYLAGARGKYFEVGGGLTYAPGLDLFDDPTNVYGTLTFGFRKQPVGKKGFTFRAAFTPIIGFSYGGSFVPSAGISFGYKF
ncbi:MAG: hypothetical protein ABJB86_21975 [Bacteroidota bacterium]